MNYDDSMTINVNGGARGNGSSPAYPSSRAGFAGSAGKVFLVSRLSFSIFLTFWMSIIVISLLLACSLKFLFFTTSHHFINFMHDAS